MQDWLGMWGQKYMEYRIQAEECSLIENYNNDDMVIRDPVALKGTDWSLMNVYIFEEMHLFEHSGLCSTSKSGRGDLKKSLLDTPENLSRVRRLLACSNKIKF